MESFKFIAPLFDTITVLSCLLGAIILNLLTRFPQFRKFKEFKQLLFAKNSHSATKNTISPLQAMFTAMSTSLGMGTIVAPPLAIAIGGPGALFWIMIYALFACVTKYTEATFAVKYKRYAPDGTIIGGPTGYLYQIHPRLADWYGLLIIFLLLSWTALQSKSLAAAYAYYSVPEYATGFVIACFTLFMLIRGIKSIAELSTGLVPLHFIAYFALCCFIIFSDLHLLLQAFISIFTHAFSSTAAVGGFVGSTVLTSIRQGTFKAAFVTEAGIGTAAIPHALADNKIPTNQGILAMYSTIGDVFCCILSGLVTLITGVWKLGHISNDLPLLAFKSKLPTLGPIAYVAVVTLFAIGTIIGNSLNASKNFAFFTNNRYLFVYYILIATCIFCGAVFHTATLWQLADFIMPLIVLPHVTGLIILTLKHKDELKA
ncbi:sodium:alanine symporter family protein [Candidatus Dependentiae bacterium]|nr:sodium:alanine symporter family protein [Candidatus Dependentiae bacterium]